jgi:hypothetical protein
LKRGRESTCTRQGAAGRKPVVVAVTRRSQTRRSSREARSQTREAWHEEARHGTSSRCHWRWRLRACGSGGTQRAVLPRRNRVLFRAALGVRPREAGSGHHVLRRRPDSRPGRRAGLAGGLRQPVGVHGSSLRRPGVCRAARDSGGPGGRVGRGGWKGAKTGCCCEADALLATERSALTDASRPSRARAGWKRETATDASRVTVEQHPCLSRQRPCGLPPKPTVASSSLIRSRAGPGPVRPPGLRPLKRITAQLAMGHPSARRQVPTVGTGPMRSKDDARWIKAAQRRSASGLKLEAVDNWGRSARSGSLRTSAALRHTR